MSTRPHSILEEHFCLKIPLCVLYFGEETTSFAEEAYLRHPLCKILKLEALLPLSRCIKCVFIISIAIIVPHVHFPARSTRR